MGVTTLSVGLSGAHPAIYRSDFEGWAKRARALLAGHLLAGPLVIWEKDVGQDTKRAMAKTGGAEYYSVRAKDV